MILFYLNLTISMIFCLTKTPITLSLLLLIQIICTILLLGMKSVSFWFSYIMFIVMIGGLMIIFIYMTSLTSNFKITTNMNFYILMIIMNLIMMTNFNFNIFYINILKPELMKITETYNQLFLIKLYNFPNFKIMWIMIIYLLMTLIFIVKLTKTNLGPIRQKL